MNKCSTFGFVFIVITASASCQSLWPRLENSRYTTLRAWQEENSREAAGERTITPDQTRKDNRLRAVVKRSLRCFNSSINNREVRQDSLYTANWPVVGTLYGAGALSLTAGIYYAVTAPSRPSVWSRTSRGDLSREGSNVLAAILLASGAAAEGLALWATLTDGLKTSSIQNVSDPAYTSEWDCGLREEFGVNVKLKTWNGETLLATSDQSGAVMFTVPAEKMIPPPQNTPFASLESEFASKVELNWDPSLKSNPTLQNLESKNKIPGESKALPLSNTVTPPKVEPASDLGKALTGIDPVPEKLLAILERDVATYFGLTPPEGEAQKTAWQLSENFKAKSSELTQLSEKVSKSTYYVMLPANIERYNLTKRVLELVVSRNFGSPIDQATPPKSDGRLIFENLPTKEVPANGKADKGKNKRRQDLLTLAVAPLEATAAQKSQETARLILILRPLAVKKINFEFLPDEAKEFKTIERKIVTTKVSTLLIADPSSGKIFYQQTLP